jgi:hypothetical protein
VSQVKDICFPTVQSQGWLQNLEATHWMKHIKMVLAGSVMCAELVEQGTSVLVHCSDGWDRTAQVCSPFCHICLTIEIHEMKNKNEKRAQIEREKK